MSSCSQCIHAKVCKLYVESLAKSHKADLNYVADWISALNGTYCEGTGCDYFRDSTRVFELPCDVGDLIYEPTRRQISIYKVTSFSVENGSLQLHLFCLAGYLTRDIVDVKLIGTTVFLTQAEAEQLLGKGGSYG